MTGSKIHIYMARFEKHSSKEKKRSHQYLGKNMKTNPQQPVWQRKNIEGDNDQQQEERIQNVF